MMDEDLLQPLKSVFCYVSLAEDKISFSDSIALKSSEIFEYKNMADILEPFKTAF